MQLQKFLEMIRIVLFAPGEKPFCGRKKEHSSVEKLSMNIGRFFSSAIDNREYLLFLRHQIPCQLFDTGWAKLVSSVAFDGVVHHVVPHHFFLLSMDSRPVTVKGLLWLSELLLRS